MRTYEQSIDELEQIIKKLESGKLDLNEAMALFKKGVALSAECNTMLSEAKFQLEMLDDEGNIRQIEPSEL